MKPGERTLAVLAGLLGGISGGLFGVGGGAVLIPLLTGWLGATQHQAHATSLAVTGITAVGSVLVYAAHHNVDWLTAVIVAIGSVLTVRYGARLAARLSPRGLRRAFALFLVVVGVRMLWVPDPGAGLALQGAAAVALDLLLGATIGLVAGFMGVGGGIIAVPGFVLMLGMPQQLAQGTSLAVILGTAPAGTIEHLKLGNVLVRLILPLAIGAAIGGAAAAFAIQSLPRTLLTRSFAVFLIANAAWAWWRAGKDSKRAAPVPA